MNAALRDVTKDYPITQTWINCLKEITAETIIEEPGFLTATIGVPGNRERRSLYQTLIRARATRDNIKVIKWRKPLKGSLVISTHSALLDTLYGNARYCDELHQYYYPNVDVMLTTNVSVRRNLTNGSCCKLIGIVYVDPKEKAKYNEAIDNAMTYNS